MNQLFRFLVKRLIALSGAIGGVVEYPFNTAWLLRAMGCSVGRRVRFSGRWVMPDIVLGDEVVIAERVRLGQRVTILAGCQVRSEAILAHDVTLNERAIICGPSYLENISVGCDSMICSEEMCLGYGHGHIEIGSHSYIGPRCVLDWSDNLVIGDFVHVSGPSTAFWTHSSVFQVLHGDVLDNKQRRTTAPITIEHHVYIGGNCTIYPGVTIGHHSIVMPNSAVNKNVPTGHMVGGVPARVIRTIESLDEIHDS